MKMSDITATGRPIDPTYPTNLAIVLLSLIAAVAGTVWHLFSGGALLESALWGIGAGIVLFLTWALGRELDPDHDLSAFVGVGLALIALLLFDPPSLLPFFWLLLVLRIVNRTMGLPARPLDTLAVLGLGAWLTWQGAWMVGLLTAIAFLLDGLSSPPLRAHLFVSGLAFVVTVVLSIFNGDMAMEGGATVPTAIASVVMAGLFLVVIATSGELRSVGDVTGEPLIPRRVQAAQAFALGTALLFAWWEGASGLEALLPLWAAMVGLSLHRMAILFVPLSRSPQEWARASIFRIHDIQSPGSSSLTQGRPAIWPMSSRAEQRLWPLVPGYILEREENEVCPSEFESPQEVKNDGKGSSLRHDG